MVSDGEAVFAAFLKSMVLVKEDGAVVFAENADVDLTGIASFELFVGPGHKVFAESVAEEFLADVDLPDLHGVGRGVFDRDVDGADFDEGDEVFAVVDDLVGEVGIGEFLGDCFFGVDVF